MDFYHWWYVNALFFIDKIFHLVFQKSGKQMESGIQMGNDCHFHCICLNWKCRREIGWSIGPLDRIGQWKCSRCDLLDTSNSLDFSHLSNPACFYRLVVRSVSIFLEFWEKNAETFGFRDFLLIVYSFFNTIRPNTLVNFVKYDHQPPQTYSYISFPFDGSGNVGPFHNKIRTRFIRA